MNKKYEEVEFLAGSTIKGAVKELLQYKDKGILACGEFNGVMLYSDTVTLDTAYKEITGKTKAEIDKTKQEWEEKLERERRVQKEKVHELVLEWQKRETPFGYVWKDGEVKINENNADILKWIYKMTLEYLNNPPNYLAKEIIDKCEEELSYDEAKGRVTLTMVERYVTAELNLRMEQYENNRQEDIREFLRKPLDKELLIAVEERYKSNSVEYSAEIITKEMYKRAVEKVEKCKE
ncbi:hypothetical protein 10S11_52 [uncultured Caudovirales phage]|uniref:Uncharacterized protein n=1 Tax=uncultured Caudovirales phage TaxID=2100421 RepID=A0A2H4J061_9CAUD|nr:hypothetical protein 10S11_52 [uncultured Caudovirales phage]